MVRRRPGIRTVRDGGHFRVINREDLKLDGYTFDSIGEKRRYAALKMLQLGGVITDLAVKPRLHMIVNGHRIGRGWIILDFKYKKEVDGEWRWIWEDYKEVITRESKVRIQVCEAIHDINITITGR